jgi:hypothetical protein
MATEPLIVPDALLISSGFAPNDYHLDLNRKLAVPYDQVLPAPWDLPSRLFRFPIEVGDKTPQGRQIGLMHPHLADHPFVRQVGEVLGTPVPVGGAPNAHGYSCVRLGLWWHAVDLMCAGKWRELLASRNFTTDQDIAGAASLALSSSRSGQEGGLGALSVSNARKVMAAIGSREPADITPTLLAVMRPGPVKQDSGVEHWPVNDSGRDDASAWLRIIGLERGWFDYERSGHMFWTQVGRDRYAGGGGGGGRFSYTEAKTGQGAFAF